MKLKQEHRKILKKLMADSAEKGNLANAGMVFENGEFVASSESLVFSDKDATAHSELMLVRQVCKERKSCYTPGLTMVTVVEPCLMCLSACSWAGYADILYIIPEARYVDSVDWFVEAKGIDKQELIMKFVNPIKLIHLKQYEEEFCEAFENAMGDRVKKQ